ncbi:Sestrin-like protein [Armadillidium vulgare]|nr:Sestrin-like protein [Armadillidium vulgare]
MGSSCPYLRIHIRGRGPEVAFRTPFRAQKTSRPDAHQQYISTSSLDVDSTIPLEVTLPSMVSSTTAEGFPKSREGGKPENGTSVPETSSFSTSTSKAPSIDTTEVKSTSAVTTTVSVCSSVPITVTQVSTKTQDDNSGTKENAVAVGGAKREIQSSPQPNKQSKNESHSKRSIPCKEETPSSLREFPHLCHDLSFTYEEFSWQASPTSNLNILEFNWQDHGYCLMTRLLNEMGNLIDERFGALKNISHPAWNKNGEDNSYNYRRAVWNYIQVSLAILIMEARTESCLLYALRAIIPHQC